MLLQGGQVIGGIRVAELARVNQAHVDIAHLGAAIGLKKQGVFAMEDRLLQRPLDHVVVQGRARHSKEQRELRPMTPHVLDRRADARVRLDEALLDLLLEPFAQVLHHRSTQLLVEKQTRLRRKLFPFGAVIDCVNLGQRGQNPLAFGEERILHIDELSSCVR